jgi:hypothetical protein
MRRPLAKVAYKALLPVGFRARLQKLLLAHEIERQRASYYKGQIFGGFGRDVSWIVVKNESVANLI